MSAGLERSLGRGFELRLDGYVKRFTDVLIGQLESEAERQARMARYDFPADLAGSIPTDPLITTVPDQRRPWHAPTASTCSCRGRPPPADARLRGWASYTWGRAERDAYGRRYAVRVRPAARVHDGRGAAAHRAAGSWRRRREWRRASRAPRRSGVRRRRRRGRRPIGDGDGVTDEILPDLDAGRPARLRGGLRRRRQPERRPPAAVRARRRPGHLASRRRRRPLGALRRGHQRARTGRTPAPSIRAWSTTRPRTGRGSSRSATRRFRACRHWGYASGSEPSLACATCAS